MNGRDVATLQTDVYIDKPNNFDDLERRSRGDRRADAALAETSPSRHAGAKTACLQAIALGRRPEGSPLS